MKSIDSELEKAGAEFRKAGHSIPDQPWEKASDRWRPRRPLLAMAAGAAVVLLIALPIALFGGGGGAGTPDPLGSATEPPSTEVASGLATPASTGAPSASLPTETTFEDPPHLLLEADGWEMVGYHEDSYEPYRSAQAPLVFRRSGARIGDPTLIAGVFEETENISWGAGADAERIELDGRVVSIMAESQFPAGHTAGIEFSDGTLVVVEAYDMDRSDFVEAVKQITLGTAGDPVVTSPAGYEQVNLPAPYSETITSRQAQYTGPNSSSAEIRTWSGTMADVELVAFGRIQEALSVRSATIDGAPVAIAYHSDNMSRVWVVGGEDGYVIEIDFNPL